MKGPYLIGEDNGFIKKIVLIDKATNDPKLKKFGSYAIQIAEASGDNEIFRGFYATAPTTYLYVDNFETFLEIGSFIHYGSLYEAQWSPHNSVRVYCYIKQEGETVSGTAFEKAMPFFKLGEE